MNVEYRIESADCEELSQEKDPLLSGEKIALENALRKAKVISEKNADSLVLGADTVVVCDNRVFGKPRSEKEAFSMLRTLSGREHSVITGVALCCKADSICEVFPVTTQVYFKSLRDEEILRYMQCVPVMDKAGAYAIQEHGEMLGARWEGELENIIGLPLLKLEEVLKKYSLKSD
jgi:septum formation protein